jgi:hypothetical protein
MSETNILKVWEQADTVDLREGMQAYYRYRTTMKNIASHFGFSLESVVGCFCALSPNNDYVGNLRSLITLLKGCKAGEDVDKLTVSTYNACKLRAWRCLGGEDFMSFTTGPKTRAFYSNILNPEDISYVTIDGHMYSLWAGKRMTMKAIAYERFNYKKVELDFKRVAFKLTLIPCQLQAILWFTWKRINNIVFQPQLGLFTGDDQWGLLPEVEGIAEFPIKMVGVRQ